MWREQLVKQVNGKLDWKNENKEVVFELIEYEEKVWKAMAILF